MTSDDTIKNSLKTKIIAAMLVTGALIIAGLVYWSGWVKSENSVEPYPSFSSTLTENERKVAEHETATAALTGTPVAGAVTLCPDYITEREWQVLQNVAKQNPSANLTDLVNKMLFLKKKQAWLSAREHSAERKLLARQLLEMIPAQLAAEAIDSQTAQEMEEQLQADLKR